MASEPKALFQSSSFVCSPLNILGDHHLKPLYPENNINKVEQSHHKIVTQLPSTGNHTEEPITDKNEIEMQQLGSIESAVIGLDFISQVMLFFVVLQFPSLPCGTGSYIMVHYFLSRS